MLTFLSLSFSFLSLQFFTMNTLVWFPFLEEREKEIIGTVIRLQRCHRSPCRSPHSLPFMHIWAFGCIREGTWWTIISKAKIFYTGKQQLDSGSTWYEVDGVLMSTGYQSTSTSAVVKHAALLGCWIREFWDSIVVSTASSGNVIGIQLFVMMNKRLNNACWLGPWPSGWTRSQFW